MIKLDNKIKSKNEVERKPAEYSFTLFEVIIAVALLTSVVMQVAGGQGSLFEITDYSKKATEATWLAKRLMSRVEYNYAQYDLKELETTTSIKDAAFDDFKDPDLDYKYSIDIQEWILPLIDFLTGGGQKSEEEKEEDKDDGKAESSVAGIPGLDGMVKQIFEDHMMKVAHVEVSWPEGVRRNSVALTYLLTNQKKLDDYILTKTAVWDSVRKKMDPNAAPDKALTGNTSGNNSGNTPPGDNTVPPGGQTTPATGRGTTPGASGTSSGGTTPEVVVPQ